MANENIKAVILGRIEAIANAEKITRVELAGVSRELLLYVPDSDDIDMVNRLLGVLTPMNKKMCIEFFKHFLPWEVEENKDGEFNRFGKRSKKDKVVKRKLEAITKFLSDEDNTVWTWGKDNLNLYKVKPFAANITKAVEKALAGDETDNGSTPALSHADVIGAVLAGGISIEDLLDAVDMATGIKDITPEPAAIAA